MNLARAAELLLAHALSLPSAWEDHPWGERVAKVGSKIFLFLGRDSARGETLLLSVKLPTSSIAALDRSECGPSGYGMGKHGWVTAKYERGDTLPVDLLKSWIVESYRAVAPKKLAQALDGVPIAEPVRRTKPTPTRSTTPKARSPAKCKVKKASAKSRAL